MSNGRKFDADKPRIDLWPVRVLVSMAKVLTFGAKKYGDRNWEAGMKWSRLYAACLRHVLAWWDGEDHDPESGLPHLDHAICNLVFLREYQATQQSLDDRPSTEKRRKFFNSATECLGSD